MTMPKAELTPELRALKQVDFDWTTHINRIWSAPRCDVSELHAGARQDIFESALELRDSKEANSPLGQFILGASGSGKTHLLSALRQQMVAEGIGFILVDMTDVHDFWETVLQGYVSSLRQDSEEGVSQFQLRRLIDHLIRLNGDTSVSAERIAKLPQKPLSEVIYHTLKALNQQYPKDTIRFQNVVRALFLLNSEDFVFADIGYSWLTGLEIDESAKKDFGFRLTLQSNLVETVEGLSWVMSLVCPWVLALDQLDSIVSQHNHAMEAATGDHTQSIIAGIGGGLMGLRDKTRRTLTLVSCLLSTWSQLKEASVQSFPDRFEEAPLVLQRVSSRELVRRLIAERLASPYRDNDYTPPYPAWPFSDAFAADAAAKDKSPRAILQRCEKHRQLCLQHNAVSELDTFAENEPQRPTDKPPPLHVIITKLFQTAQTKVDVQAAQDEQQEDTLLGQWLHTAARCLIWENPTPDSIDPVVEVDFPGGKNYPQLHTRLRLVYRDEGDREKHLSLRALLRNHHAAYSTRLKAAITTAGIDHNLSFRRLLILRPSAPPSGPATQKLTDQFIKAGGILAQPSADELRVLGALHALIHDLRVKDKPGLEAWFVQNRPVSQLPCLQEIVGWLFDEWRVVTGEPTASESPDVAPLPTSVGEQTTPTPAQSNTGLLPTPTTMHTNTGDRGHKSPTPAPTGEGAGIPPVPEHELPLGQTVGGLKSRWVSLPLERLTRHLVVLAGSGAGKTVLVRRLLEEAVLQHIPAIVIDGANDLALLGDAWPTAPASWTQDDQVKAQRYHARVDPVIWTPGREAGRPLSLDPLPDFAALTHDPDELQQAIAMVQDSLQERVAPGNSETARLKHGVLRIALEHFAKSDGAQSLEGFAEFLRTLTDEDLGPINKASKHAQTMADLISAEIANNALLRQSGTPLDPATLFGLDNPSEKTRVSIINFIGLPGLGQQQQFLNQLAMTLFTWIKKNPAPPGQPVRGLLVIDEAKDFVPAVKSTPCKASMLRLAAQARKYGLGLIFATQEPKSIDHQIIANCLTQFYGRTSSPAAIDVVQNQLQQRGGQGNDISRLHRGQFYVASESIHPPVKIESPLCLSYHPSSPLDEAAVLARAKA